jgi:isocitrate dehydrogenase
VPENPIIPFIRGDGTGPTSGRPACACSTPRCKRPTAASENLLVRGFRRREAFKKFNNWLPDDTVEAFKEYLVGIKGPLTTPVGGGIRSLNVALRQMLDLYVCLRPVQWFTGVPPR